MKYQVTVGKEICFTQMFEIEAATEGAAYIAALKRARECQGGWEGGTDADYYVDDIESSPSEMTGEDQ